MKMRRLSWCWLAILIATWSIAMGDVARGQERERFVRAVGRVKESILAERNEFVLHAPASRVAAIAARYGLTVIRPLDEHAHDVFLVSGPGRFGSRFQRVRTADIAALEQLVSDVQGDSEVGRFEKNGVVVTPELASATNLAQTAAAGVQAALSNRT